MTAPVSSTRARDDGASAEPCVAGGLVSVEEACRRAALCAGGPVEASSTRLEDCLGRVLARPVRAGVALPPFDQSAMDGFAVRAGDIRTGPTRLPVSARIAAGEEALSLAPMHAARIFTGAPIPKGADCVVMQEHARRDDNFVVIDGPVRADSNIRRRGEDCLPGQHLLDAGRRLDARAIAMFSAQGIDRLEVHRALRIAILSTGNELMPSRRQGNAAIHDSNRPMLMALARQRRLEVQDLGQVGDDVAALARCLSHAKAHADLIVTTGGVSVGEEDHTEAALQAAGGSWEPLRIAMKPGKPAVVGRLGACAFLGLPGSPNGALVGWMMMGRAMIAALEGAQFTTSPPMAFPLARPYHRTNAMRREFVPACLQGSAPRVGLHLLAKPGAARLSAILAADGLADIPAGVHELPAGEPVGFHPFRDWL